MLKNTDVTRQNTIDLSQEIMVLNAEYTPLLSLLLARNKNTKANDVVVRRKLKQLSKNASGGRKEGADAPESEHSTYTWVENNLEIFTKATDVSGTAGAILGSTKGALASEMVDGLTAMKYDIEEAILTGVKKNEDGASGRKMDGLINIVDADNVVDVSGGALTQGNISEAMMKLYQLKVTGERLMFANPADIEKVTELYTKAENTRLVLNVGDNTVGIDATKIKNAFGVANLVMSNYIPVGTLLFITIDYIEYPELRQAHYQGLAKTGDSEKGQVVAESTIITAPKSLAKIVNFI